VDKEFLKTFTEDIAPQMAYMGIPMTEAEMVRNYMEGSDKYVEYLEGRDDDAYFVDVPDKASEPKRFMKMRDRALESKYGRRFADQYIQNKLLGQGGTGSVFEKPGDPSRVLKAQRLTEDPMYEEPEVGIQPKFVVDKEIDIQARAGEAGLSPRLHSVESYPIPKRKYHHGYPNRSKQDEIMNIMEMDRVSTVEDEGGFDEIIDRKVKNFGFDNTKDYPYKESSDKKQQYIQRKDQMIKAENAKKALALSKLHLGLADQGVIHTDLGYGGERPDHLVYDPYSNKMQAIDFNQVQTFKHSNNLHKHTRNQNLLSEELQEYSPEAQAMHFLDHKSKSIFNGMMAVGQKEEAHLYNDLYKEIRAKGDLIATEDLVNQGQEIINKHTMKDVDNFHLKFLKKRK